MLICWVHLYRHSITVVWGLETCWGGLGTVTEEVVEGVWKLLLIHCPCCSLVAGTFHYLDLKAREEVS